MDKKIADNNVNREITEKLNKNPRYEAYKNWLRSNGVLWQHIEFPAAFGPTGFVGVAAADDIPASSVLLIAYIVSNTVDQPLVAIPNKLLITTTKVLNGELSQFMKENPAFYKDDGDADFNILATFLLREKIKGKDSFYAPMIDVLDNTTILLYWNKDEIQELDDPHLFKEAAEFEANMIKSWDQFKQFCAKYPDLFPPEKVTKEDYYWAHEAVATRCFGWSLPATMLVPMADFFNHNTDGATHYIVNTRFEKQSEYTPPTYIIKKRRVDLSIFNDEELKLSPEERDIFYGPPTERLRYIKMNIDRLSEANKRRVESGDHHKEDLKKMIREINFDILSQFEDNQIWDLPWFESDNEEDNDTEYEESEDEEEEDEQEKEKDQNQKSEEKANIENKEAEETKETVDTTKTKKDEESDNDEADNEDEDDEEEEEDEEQDKVEREDYKHGNKIINEEFSPTKYMKHRVSDYEKLEVEKIHKKSPNKRDENQPDPEPEAGDEDSKWKWFTDSDNETYFIVATHPALTYKKGEQIYSCYGRRTNRFLMMWYGFCIPNNKYNSLSFRLWMNKTTLTHTSPPKELLFKEYISDKEWEDKALEGEPKRNPEDLTDEFRVKMNKLCEEVLSYLRAQLLLNYKGHDLQRILVTMPKSIPYEEFVINYAISIFIEIKKQYQTSPYHDEELIKEPNLNFRRRIAILYRLEQKRIADVQIQLLRILLSIMEKLKSGVTFKECYMEYLPDIDRNNDGFIEDRRRLSNYLKLLYNNYNSE